MTEITITLSDEDQQNITVLFDMAVGGSQPGMRMQTAAAASTVLAKIHAAKTTTPGAFNGGRGIRASELPDVARAS